jgi:hypothetical protein
MTTEQGPDKPTLTRDGLIRYAEGTMTRFGEEHFEDYHRSSSSSKVPEHFYLAYARRKTNLPIEGVPNAKIPWQEISLELLKNRFRNKIAAEYGISYASTMSLLKTWSEMRIENSLTQVILQLTEMARGPEGIVSPAEARVTQMLGSRTNNQNKVTKEIKRLIGRMEWIKLTGKRPDKFLGRAFFNFSDFMGVVTPEETLPPIRRYIEEFFNDPLNVTEILERSQTKSKS